MKYAILAAFLWATLSLPAAAAGFAKQSLFLSKEPVTEGETVLIHAVVANENAQKFSGDVVFKDGDTNVGSVAVAIASGGANAVSVSWKPSAGSHAVTAELTDTNGTVVEQQNATFKIEKKPDTTQNKDSSAAAVESSRKIQDKIEDYSPAAASAVAPVFSTIDSARSKAADALDSGINWAKDKTGGKEVGEVLGSSTKNPSSSSIMDTLWFILATVALYALTVLRFIVGSAGIFYPVFALFVFFVLWRTYKRFRRPSYAY
jgi:hypothetical protein